MFASDKPQRSEVKLDEFLSKLKEALTKCAGAIMSASHIIPAWANSCANLLYCDKSIPPEVSEPGRLYIAYKTDDPSAVQLIGKSKDKKPINRKLKIVQQASNLITITSEHKDFVTGKSFTCKGVGKTFQNALDHYFASSDLKKPDYTYNTDGNIQKEGDAFLLPQVINSKGSEFLVTEMINTVSKLIDLIPKEKHQEVQTIIEKNIKDFDKFLKAKEADKIVNHYDARLWLIVETVCQHLDPLTAVEDPRRKDMRDYFIAECCSKFAKGEDIIARLKGYFDAMKMHFEIFEASKQKDPEGFLKVLVNEYKKNNLYPEHEGHREKIREYHGKCKVTTEGEGTKRT